MYHVTICEMARRAQLDDNRPVRPRKHPPGLLQTKGKARAKWHTIHAEDKRHCSAQA